MVLLITPHQKATERSFTAGKSRTMKTTNDRSIVAANGSASTTKPVKKSARLTARLWESLAIAEEYGPLSPTCDGLRMHRWAMAR